MSRVVYSRHYNLGFFGLERLHPFDSQKYGRAWRVLRRRLGTSLSAIHVRPRGPVSRDDLLTVHTPAYLDRLRLSPYVARAIEVPPVRKLPAWMVDWRVLKPMRWATQGTVAAAREALQHGLVVNLGGGFHHAKPDVGEGFCLYADAALAVESVRRQELIASGSRVVYIDLDAHQGNGFCHCVRDDPSVFIFDMFNGDIYPCTDTVARERIDCPVPLPLGCVEREYLGELHDRLPGFLDSVANSAPIALAIYNAGTDVYAGDPLGGLNVSAAGILKRDLFVVEQLRSRGIATVMVLSGGYTRESYQLVADSVAQLITAEEQRQAAR